MDKKDNNTNEETAVRPPKKKKKTGLIILAVVLTLLIALASAAAYTVLLHEPDTGTEEPPPFDTEGLNEIQTPETDGKGESSSPSAPSTGETAGETTPDDPDSIPRSKQKIYNFLFVGQDRIALNTDVIMLISFNTTKNTVSVIQIPRDTYIGISTYVGKINGLYASYYLSNGNDAKAALRSFADTLEQSLCIKIHNVGHINLDGVVALVDSIGGVDVNLPAAITYYDETAKTNYTLPAGKQHLNGRQAEAFVRHRASYLQADIGRIDAQKVFVSAFVQKLKSNFTVGTVTKFVDIAFNYVTTDVSLADAVFYAKKLLDVDMSSIKLMSMIGNGATGDGLSYYVMVRKNMREMINSYFNIYDFDITEGIFDKDRIFSGNPYYPHFNNIYTREDLTTKDPHNAGDINDDSINIPHY